MQMDRRAFLGLAALVGLSGCSSMTRDEAAPRVPVTLQHAFGETVITHQPQRVACWGPGVADVCVALGLVPVVMTIAPVMSGKFTPWFEDVVATLAGPRPDTIPADDGNVMKRLAAFSPDLILAVGSELSEGDFTRLSEIAPVVAQPNAEAAADWVSLTETVGRAIGQSDAAADLIAETETTIAELLEPYDSFAGETAVFIEAVRTPGAELRVFGSATTQSQALSMLGLAPAPMALQLEAAGKLNPNQASYFPASELAADQAALVIASLPDRQLAESERDAYVARQLERDPETTIQLSEKPDGYALRECSPLSLVWIAESLAPRIAKSRYVLEHS